MLPDNYETGEEEGKTLVYCYIGSVTEVLYYSRVYYSKVQYSTLQYNTV